MISWDKARLPQMGTQTRVFASPEWDLKFRKIRPQNLKPAFRMMFSDIKATYRSRGWLTEKQAQAINVCWEVHNQKERSRRGVSGRSFGGLPGVVYEPGVF